MAEMGVLQSTAVSSGVCSTGKGEGKGSQGSGGEQPQIPILPHAATTTPGSKERASWWLSSVWGLSCAFSECARLSFYSNPKM